MRALFLVAAAALVFGFIVWAQLAQEQDCKDSGGRWVVTSRGDTFCLPQGAEP